MLPRPIADAGVRSREWRIAAVLLVAVILLRAGVFLLWSGAHFDSDQAVMGLMAKHLAEGRAFPVFFYGQNYILGVEAWMAAPLFAIAGASVTALKLPLLAVNIAVVLLLFGGFTREVGLRPYRALVATLFFALPAVGTAADLVDASGGNVEPFLYALLLWRLRHRPVLCGLVFGFGFVHREFTLYGFIALLAISALRRELFSRRALLRTALSVAAAAVVWGGVQLLKQVSSAAGPGTTIADVAGPSSNIGELAMRTCIDPGTVGKGVRRVLFDHWPTLFGTAQYRLTDFGIVSSLTQGAPWSGVLLAALLVLPVVVVVWRLIVARRLPRELDFCLFVVLVGLLSVGGYIAGRCGEIDFYFMRYELLSVMGTAGLAAWFLRTTEEGNFGAVRKLWLSLALVWFVFTVTPHVRLWHEYLTGPPADARKELIAQLDARGIRYGSASYWISYVVSFLTDERIILKSSDFVRVRSYEAIVDAHANEAIRISREPCGEEVMRRIYFCK